MADVSAMRFVVFLHVGQMASTALFSFAALLNQVTTLTMGSPRINSSGRIAARIVDFVSDKFDMRITNARTVAAKMISFKSVGAIWRQEVVRPNNPSVHEEFSVPVRFESCNPDPARPQVWTMLRNWAVLVDLFQEAVFRRSMRWHKAGNLTTKARVQILYV